ncbi:hypothetical protein KEM54_003584 [Ascosphaera aggregata]|nr:hypothetical protein KEM54_003584 [Ascosphaera aggregata]
MEADSLDRDDERDFWPGVDKVLTKPCESAGEIDEVLRQFLELITEHQGLFNCPVNAEEEPNPLYVFALFLLLDGRNNEETFVTMSNEGAFAHALKLIHTYVRADHSDCVNLNRVLLDLMYEMARIQRLRIDDLMNIDDSFVAHLFEVIEDPDGGVVDDPFNYPVIRVLLALNEQYLLVNNDLLLDGSSVTPPTNRVIKVLCETSLQLLVLKLLYLLFTTPPTYEYFYTNDLHVLVDILIRNLYDLPEEQQSLRHTYLRVLFPLLANTQLKYPPHYKRQEVKKLLGVLLRQQLFADVENEEILHFEEVDETTRRLVRRCSDIGWLVGGQGREEDDKGASQNNSDGETPGTFTAKQSAEETSSSPPESSSGQQDQDLHQSMTLENSGIHSLTRVATLPANFGHDSSGAKSPTYRSRTPEAKTPDMIMDLPVRSGSTLAVNERVIRQPPEPPVPRRIAMHNRKVREAVAATGGTPTPTLAEPPSPFPPFLRSTPVSANVTRSNTPEDPGEQRRMQRAMSFQRPEPPQPPPPHPRLIRTVSLQPPAVPPRRRASHSAPSQTPPPPPPPPPPPGPKHLHSQNASPIPPVTPRYHHHHLPVPSPSGQKPEPPVARRLRTRRLHQQQEQQEQQEQREEQQPKKDGFEGQCEPIPSPQLRVVVRDTCLSTSPASTSFSGDNPI